MRKITLFFSVLVFSVSSFSQAPNWVWATGFGDLTLNVGMSITTDTSGNVYTVGYFMGTVDFDPGIGSANLTSFGARDIFILKLDASGNFIWIKQMGGSGSEQASAVSIDAAGSIYVTGTFAGTADFDPEIGVHNLTSNSAAGDIFVVKLNAGGNFLWAKAMGGFYTDSGMAIALDAFGNLYITGYFQDVVDFDPGPGISNLTCVGAYDVFVARFDTAGNFNWAKGVGGSATDWGYSVAVDSAGNVYTVGTYGAAGDFNPGPAIFNLPFAGIADAFILKLNSSGNFVWAKSIGGIKPDIARSIVFDPSTPNNFYVAGDFYNQADFNPGTDTFYLNSLAYSRDVFILKMNTSGNFLWAKSMGGNQEDVANIITADDVSNIYIGGYFNSTADFDPDTVATDTLTSQGLDDIFICKLDSHGNHIWAQWAGGASWDDCNSIAVARNGQVYATGTVRSTPALFGSLSVSVPAGAPPPVHIFIAALDTTLTGIEPIEQHANISLFPNPASNELTIENAGLKIKEVEIYSSIGEKVFSSYLSSFITHHSIDVGQLSPGIYFITVTDQGGNKVTRKVVKM